MLKILQARLQQYVNKELPDVQADVEKAEETDQIANIRWMIKKARESQKKKNLLLLYYLCQNLWLGGSQQSVKSFKRWEY